MMGKKIKCLNPLFQCFSDSIIPIFQLLCSAVDIFFFISGGRRDFYNFLSPPLRPEAGWRGGSG
jgi:hypothetical protein